MTTYPSPSFVIIRLPLLPVTALNSLFQACRSEPIAQILDRFYQQPLVAEALYLASPSLYNEWQAWQFNTGQPLRPGVATALLKYAIRMSSRCTPFGLFSGLAIVHEANHTAVNVVPEQLQPIIRLDSNGLVQLFARLQADETVRRSWRYMVNNSMYRLGSELRYSEFTESSTTRLVQISALETDELLDAVVQQAASYQSFADLVTLVSEIATVTVDQAATYIDSLIDARLLVSELEPTVTGLPYLDRLVNSLQSVVGRVPLVDEFLTLVSTQTLPLCLTHWKRIDAWFSSHQFTADYRRSLIQTNSYVKLSPGQISSEVINHIRQQVSEVAGLSAQPEPSWLTTFKERFYSRYENEEVSLLTALDNDAGIGLQVPADFRPVDAPLMDALIQTLNPEPVLNKKSSSLDTLRRTMYNQALQSGMHQIHLPTSALANLPDVLPTSWSILGSLLASSGEVVDQSDYQFMLRSLQGPSSALLLGRFCQDSPELTALVQAALAAEEAGQPDLIFAEIVHLTGGRSGNVTARPVLRFYEIPYITPPAVPSTGVIPLSDILISVPDGRTIVLRSKRLAKQIIPRLTTAQETSSGDDIYRFLSTVGRGSLGLGAAWSWGDWRDEPRLPRIIYKQLILSRAQWCFKQEHFTNFKSFHAALAEFRRRFQMPDWVVLITGGDNELVLDISVPVAVELLAAEFRNSGQVRLVECLAKPDRCWVRNNNGDVYAHELVISGVAPVNLPPLQPVINRATIPSRDRIYLPGSEWLYFKVYTGPQTVERLLTDVFYPLLQLFKTENNLSEWHFVRYYDPEFHLRLRIKRPASTSASAEILGLMLTVIHNASQEATKQGLVHRLQLDTYQREIERYGPETIDLCESLFSLNSEMLIQFLLVSPYPTEAQRMQFALQSAQVFIDDFGWPPPEVISFFRQRQRAYWQEFGAQKAVRDRLNQLYRDWTPYIDAWLSERTKLTFSDSTDYTTLLSTGSLAMKPIIGELVSKLARPGSPALVNVVASLMHMSMNRIFTSQLRLNELIVHHFLARHYESHAARSKVRQTH